MSRTTKTLALLIVLAALMGGYAGIQRINENKAQIEEQSGHFALTDDAAEDVTGLQWTVDEVTMNFVWQDGAWVNAQDADFPVDQEKVQALAASVAGLEGTRKLENVENAGDYGLEDPAFTLKVTWSNANETTYRLGDETPFGDGWYMSLSTQENVVYAVNDDLSDFDIALMDLAQFEDMPEVADVQMVSVGEMQLIRQTESQTVDPDQLWYGQDGTPLDASQVENLIDQCENLEFQDLVATSASDEMLAQWGLDEDQATDLILENADGDRLAIRLGDSDGNGGIYARLADSNRVYTLDGDAVSEILDESIDDMAVTDLICLTWENLAAMTVTDGDTVWQFEHSNDEDEEVVTLNGEAVDADSVKSVWSLMEGLADQGQAEISGDALLEFTLTSLNGKSASYAIYPQNADCYGLTVDDGEGHLVSAETVDKMIRYLQYDF